MASLNTMLSVSEISLRADPRSAGLQLNVKLMVDAEHSYFQPAIGAHFDSLPF